MVTEYFDQVDQNDRVIGRVSRDEAHKKGLCHRAVHIFFQNFKGNWILQKRSAFKDVDPLLWTTSCSGHVDEGESYAEAAVRESEEELGVNISSNDLIEIFRCNPCDCTGMEFVRVYLSKRKFEHFYPNQKEIEEIKSFEFEQMVQKSFSEKALFSCSFLHILPFVALKMIYSKNDS